MQKHLDIRDSGLQVVSFAIGVAIVLLLIGGSVYKTDCYLANGVHTHGWELGETLPYLTGTHSGCENHSLTRYLLGKTGVMSDVEK